MGDDGKILIELRGQQYRITPPQGDVERLRRAAAYVEEKIASVERAGVVASQRASLLAALDIALELLERRESSPALNTDEMREASTRLDQMIRKLDGALSETP